MKLKQIRILTCLLNSSSSCWLENALVPCLPSQSFTAWLRKSSPLEWRSVTPRWMTVSITNHHVWWHLRSSNEMNSSIVILPPNSMMDKLMKFLSPRPVGVHPDIELWKEVTVDCNLKREYYQRIHYYYVFNAIPSKCSKRIRLILQTGGQHKEKVIFKNHVLRTR